jgi:hypothetical protein
MRAWLDPAPAVPSGSDGRPRINEDTDSSQPVAQRPDRSGRRVWRVALATGRRRLRRRQCVWADRWLHLRAAVRIVEKGRRTTASRSSRNSLRCRAFVPEPFVSLGRNHGCQPTGRSCSPNRGVFSRDGRRRCTQLLNLRGDAERKCPDEAHTRRGRAQLCEVDSRDDRPAVVG